MDLPYRSRTLLSPSINLPIFSAASTSTCTLEKPKIHIHPLPSEDGVLIKIEPPREPQDGILSHVPCDIVLVIDVSVSMHDLAPAMGVNENGDMVQENAGFTVLDITKHAALTVLETMDENDRLGIVTFSTAAKIIQRLLPMTASNKELAAESIRGMRVESATNLWDGIREGQGLFEDEFNTGRVPAVMVLTDGQPNHGDPDRGYVATIRSMQPLPATIHTFGFGYNIKSGLLKSIAEIGGGNYAFIPDSGMVGTVFINAMAHLQSTFANKCVLEIIHPKFIELQTTTGKTVDTGDQHEQEKTGRSQLNDIFCSSGTTDHQKLTIKLGNVQYGQSRDIYLRYESNLSPVDHDPDFDITAEFKYSLMQSPQYSVSARKDLLEETDLPQPVIAYHQSKSMLCKYLSSLFPMLSNGERLHRQDPLFRAIRFRDLMDRMPASNHADPFNTSLMEDVQGQVQLAALNDSYFQRWGRHYFLSLWEAHEKQICNTFKDPGVQVYGIDSPLFLKCKEALETAFSQRVKPLAPSRSGEADQRYKSGGAILPIEKYNDKNGGCFAGSSLAALASGHQVAVCKLRKGMAVQTPLGSRQVAAILKMGAKRMVMCQVGNLTVTPWHPIMDYEGVNGYSGAIYSVLLEPDEAVDAHAIKADGVWGVTLGHGLLAGTDVRAHRFLGDYERVAESFKTIGADNRGFVRSAGVRRDGKTGRICGFRGVRGGPCR
ncbi:hint-domain-containing protein [Pseudomassariella vexata]|uniref:Hint-domain-domain-containing protein n=1 Tax=Pseudomassariella vexata TaxID=1141098 RepID=A0A1Y2DQH0_9PEZI|nr:hint-domain-containing protein [Pseudomassariella vexata]ORY61500.1 hint-domain-domain-containing protein [Pseudomassariella vexata]